MKPRSAWLGYSGTAIILIIVFVRIMTVPSRIPYWDLDPLTNWMPETTRTPVMGLLMDALIWIAAAAVVWAESASGRRIAWKTGLFVVIGSVGVFLHGLILTPLTGAGGTLPLHGDLAMLTLGSAWASAMIGAWALGMAAREIAMKRILIAVLIGFVCMLCIRGGYQVLIDHPRTVAAFEANKETLLITQGIEPGSTTAMLYERRLQQAEATGWSGLANVYGSMMATGQLAWILVSIAAIRLARRGEISSGEAGLVVLVTMGCGLALMWSGSKGAVGALLVGSAVLGCAWWLGRRSPAAMKWLPRIMICIPAVVLLGIVLRGVIGERIGELSLLFRWHYLTAASRIIADYPLTGVGPAGFKDAYMLAKPALNPEEVESPHSLFFDWFATLGIFGMAWAAVWLRWLWLGGSFARDSNLRTVDASLGTGWMASVVVLAAGISIWCEWAALGLDQVLLLGLAAAAWFFVSHIVVRLFRLEESLVFKIMVGCLALLAAHAMIELTPVSSNSAAWFMAIFAVFSAPSHTHDARNRSISFRVILSAILVIIGGVLIWRATQTMRWEHALKQAAAEAKSISAPTTSGVTWPCNGVSNDHISRLLTHLSRAYETEPSMMEVLSHTLRIRLGPASCPDMTADQRSDSVREAVTIAELLVLQRPRSANAWARLAGTFEAGWSITGEPENLQRAIEAWGHVAVLDPNGLTPRLRLVQLSRQVGDRVGAAAWAVETLQIDDSLRLDPLRQLSPTMRRLLESIAQGEPVREPAE